MCLTFSQAWMYSLHARMRLIFSWPGLIWSPQRKHTQSWDASSQKGFSRCKAGLSHCMNSPIWTSSCLTWCIQWELVRDSPTWRPTYKTGSSTLHMRQSRWSISSQCQASNLRIQLSSVKWCGRQKFPSIFTNSPKKPSTCLKTAFLVSKCSRATWKSNPNCSTFSSPSSFTSSAEVKGSLDQRLTCCTSVAAFPNSSSCSKKVCLCGTQNATRKTTYRFTTKSRTLSEAVIPCTCTPWSPFLSWC